MATEILSDTVNRLDREQSVEDGDAGDTDAGQDTRSSSLSDLEDGPSDEQQESASVKNAENNSEAETERLEQTPQKPRRNRDVLLTPGSQRVVERSPSKLTQEIVHDKSETPEDDETDPDDTPLKTTLHRKKENNENLIASVPEKSKSPLPSMAGQKRKRRSRNGVDETEPGPEVKRLASVKQDLDHEDESPMQDVENPDNEDTSNEEEEGGEEGAVDEPANELSRDSSVSGEVERPSKGTTRNGTKLGGGAGRRQRRQKGRKDRRRSAMEDERSVTPEVQSEQNPEATVEDELEEEDGDVETEKIAGLEEDEAEQEEEEPETFAKNEEELNKRRVAMDSLKSIENHFATFRDKLYDERLAHLSAELDLLTSDQPSHPDFLSMLQCLDERRDAKIELEHTRLQYKVKSLQVKSTAERSQILSQYFQTTRDLRESSIESIGDQWYQIQRGRRSCEGRVPDYTMNFPTRRSQQVNHQTAYNHEVSVLAGVRKYVGFPAAPLIEGAKTQDTDQDMRAMGIKTHHHHHGRNHNHKHVHDVQGITESAF